jgi:hypothetical protein
MTSTELQTRVAHIRHVLFNSNISRTYFDELCGELTDLLEDRKRLEHLDKTGSPTVSNPRKRSWVIIGNSEQNLREAIDDAKAEAELEKALGEVKMEDLFEKIWDSTSPAASQEAIDDRLEQIGMKPKESIAERARRLGIKPVIEQIANDLFATPWDQHGDAAKKIGHKKQGKAETPIATDDLPEPHFTQDGITYKK